MDGIGPEQLTIKELLARLQSGEVQEVVMATNPTVEGKPPPCGPAPQAPGYQGDPPGLWASQWAATWNMPMR